MPLSAAVHPAAWAVCVAASLVMLASASGRAPRLAHGVMLACMVVLLLGPGSVYVALGSAGLLAVAAAAVALRSRDRAAYSCAVDLTAAAGLVLLMAVPLLLAGHAAPVATHGGGLHAGVHAVVPGGADHQALLAAAAALLVATWAVARRAVPGTGGRRPGAAAWVMLLAMGAMVAA